MGSKVLSVIVPSYNMEDYLPKCLGSLVVDDNDLLQDLEVIVVNDGSKDHTSKIAHGFADRHPGDFRVIDKENGNYGSCINAALPLASGFYIKVLDADDSVDTTAFGRLLAVLKEEMAKGSSSADLVVTDYESIDPDGNTVEQIRYHFPVGPGRTLNDVEEDSPRFTIHSIVYRTNLLRTIDYRQSEGISYTDTEWITTPMHAVGTVAYIPVVVTKYLLGRAGQTVDESTFVARFQQVVIITERLVREFPDNAARALPSSRRYYKARVLQMVDMVYRSWLFGRNGIRVRCDLRALDNAIKDVAEIREAVSDIRAPSDKFPLRFVVARLRSPGVGTLQLAAFRAFLLARQIWRLVRRNRIQTDRKIASFPKGNDKCLAIRFWGYFYRYGFWNCLKKSMNQSWRPYGMGSLFYFRNGIGRVGQSRFPQTLKSGRVRNMVNASSSIRIVLTHNGAGGSKAYIRDLLPRGGAATTVFIVFPALRGGVLFVRSHGVHGETVDFAIRSLDAFRGLSGKSCEIVLNELTSWNCYEKDGLVSLSGMTRLASDIISLKRRLNAMMRFLVHDYYSICPNYSLVTPDLRYCANEEKCEGCVNCLRDNPCLSLPALDGFDIRRWRAAFAALMRECNEVRTFSDDSAQRIRLCFPETSPTIVPHKPIARFQRKPKVRFDHMIIGVVGRITEIKGSAEVRALAQYIQMNKLPAKVKVLGTMVGITDGIEVLGRYRPDELPDIIERSGVNIVFFSSICPETFSYVTQEVMDLGLPVACFDLGAPRERIKTYRWGAIIPEIRADVVWNTLSSLYSKARSET